MWSENQIIIQWKQPIQIEKTKCTQFNQLYQLPFGNCTINFNTSKNFIEISFLVFHNFWKLKREDFCNF